MVGERDLVVADRGVEFLGPVEVEPAYVLALAPGRYRFRVHVRGRADAYALGPVTSPHERHRIVCWPADQPSAPATLTAPDAYSVANPDD